MSATPEVREAALREVRVALVDNAFTVDGFPRPHITISVEAAQALVSPVVSQGATTPAGETAVERTARRLYLADAPGNEEVAARAWDASNPASLVRQYWLRLATALAASPADTDTAERIAQAIEAWALSEVRFTFGRNADPSQEQRVRAALIESHGRRMAQIAREHATTPPVAATSEEDDRG